MGTKLNLGASPIWEKKGWHVLDHKITKTEYNRIAGDATHMDIPDESCDIVYCSHVFEHIPHIQLPLVISEINRVLKPGGIFRMLTPDLKKIAKAYVENDNTFFEDAKKEDSNIRTDLGLGGMFMNFIVSPGQDTILLDRGLKKYIAGYAHLYAYDFGMMKIILQTLGFNEIVESKFCDSSIEELKEPLHVISLPPIWENMNQEFYKKNNLKHILVNGKYEINFKVTGFDRDPLTSLIIEAKKNVFFNKKAAHDLLNESSNNYNKYAYSLLSDQLVVEQLIEKNIDIGINFNS